MHAGGTKRETPASIRKSELEIKNQCTKEGVNREKRTSIPKSGPEIKNRCRKHDHLQHITQHLPQHAFHHALTTRLALDVLHGDGLDAGSAVAAKAGADAPGGGISLCFCRRGCAAPAQKAATLNDPPPRNQPKPPRSTSRHAERTVPQAKNSTTMIKRQKVISL